MVHGRAPLRLRDSHRGFRRNGVYAVVVFGTLALTLGATTAVFSIVNGVLLRALAYREAQRLVTVREVIPRVASQYPTLPAKRPALPSLAQPRDRVRGHGRAGLANDGA